MADFPTTSAYQIVTLVDRAMLGGCDIIHDGVRVTFAKGQVEKAVPQFLAEWLLQVDQHKVHTKDGLFIQRFAVKDPPEDLLARLGPEAGNCDPIELDTTRREGWDTDTYAPDRGKTRVIELRRNPADFERQGVPVTATFSAKER